MNSEGCIESGNLNTPLNNDPNLPSKLNILGISKTVKLFGLLDILFSVYYALSLNSWFLILALLSWCGYYGATKFEYKYIILYGISILIYIIGKFIILSFSNNIILCFFNLISFLSEVYLLFIVVKFYKTLRTLSGEVLNELQDGNIPRIISFVYY